MAERSGMFGRAEGGIPLRGEDERQREGPAGGAVEEGVEIEGVAIDLWMMEEKKKQRREGCA